MIKVKRIYEIPSEDDGFRILVDRLWPRGLSKDKAKIDLWMKEVSPSDELRKWFHQEVREWNEFKNLYFRELSEKEELVRFIANKGKTGPVTLLFGAKNNEFNNAVALYEYVKTVTKR